MLHDLPAPRKINYLHITGCADNINNDRRFFVVDADTPPPGHTPTDAIELLPLAPATQVLGNDCLLTIDSDGQTTLFAQRHDHATCFPERLGRWNCAEYRRDALEREWRRQFLAVTDDFGWLVEVPAC